MITTLMLEVEDDVVYMNILNHKLDLNGNYGQTSKPQKTSIDITTTEYRYFLQTFGFGMNEMKRWFNDVILLEGIRFPYKIDQIKSDIKF